MSHVEWRPHLAGCFAVQAQLYHHGIQLWSNTATTKLEAALLALLEHAIGEGRSTQLVADRGETAPGLGDGLIHLPFLHHFNAKLQRPHHCSLSALNSSVPYQAKCVLDNEAGKPALERSSGCTHCCKGKGAERLLARSIKRGAAPGQHLSQVEQAAEAGREEAQVCWRVGAQSRVGTL